jgi:hypothetical protein
MGVSVSNPREDYPEGQAPEDEPGEPGAEGGTESPDNDSLPGEPAEGDSALGDTDQHSDA